MKFPDFNSYQWYLYLTKTKPFFDKLENCQICQDKLLLSIIDLNKNTTYGREHNFQNIIDVDTFQKNIKIQKYEDFLRYIEDEKCGIKNSITSREIVYFAITSGTTSYPKYLPQTQNYIDLRKKAWEVWINQLYKKVPGTFSIFGGILTFTAKPYDGFTLGNVEYGSVSGRIHDLQPFYIKFLYSPPDEILLIDNFELKYYLIILFSLKKDVTLIVTPNPSTLILFAKKFDKYYYNLISDLTNNSISMLEEDLSVSDDLKKKILKKYSNLNENKNLAFKLKKLKRIHGVILPKYIFTNLCSIGTWTGGSVGVYAKKLYSYYGESITIRDIGFMASEGIFSIPVEDSDNGDGVLNIDANFYEFIEMNDYGRKNKVLLAHELEIGCKYYILITNENGLYRYFMDDIVEVVKFIGKTPVIKFIQKGKYFSSIVGEKISEWEVIEALNFVHEKIKFDFHTFFVVGNIKKQIPFYEYHIEFENRNIVISKIKEIEKMLDDRLKELNIEYREKRDSGRLKSIKIVKLPKNIIVDFKKVFSENSHNDSQVKVPKLFVIEKDIEILKSLKLI